MPAALKRSLSRNTENFTSRAGYISGSLELEVAELKSELCASILPLNTLLCIVTYSDTGIRRNYSDLQYNHYSINGAGWHLTDTAKELAAVRVRNK